MKQSLRFSIRVSIGVAQVGSAILASSLVGVTIFTLWTASLSQESSHRLRSIAVMTASQIDPALHARITSADQVGSPAYEALRKPLLTARTLNPDIHFFYTFRWSPGEPAPRFVLDTGTGDSFSPAGQVYESLTPTLKEAFAPPYQVRLTPTYYTDQYGSFLSAFAPILNPDGSLEGVLGVDIDRSRINAYENQLLFSVLGISAGILAFLAPLSWWIGRRISRPLRALSADMEHIRQLQIEDAPRPPTRITEVYTMQESLANMKRGLRSFKKYVPAELVKDLIALDEEADLGTVKAEVTVFFCDLANFTAASEKLSAEDLNRLLTGYFDRVTKVLQDSGATIDKFIGDSVMAFWNAPRTVEDHGYVAAQASLRVHAELEKLAIDWEVAGLPPMGARIGLNTGVVLVGNVGHAERFSYTVLGDPVNLASRLESLNKYYGTKLLVGEETILSIGGRLPWRPVDRVAVMGKSQGQVIAELDHQEPSWWPAYRQAWYHYQKHDYAVALEAFEGVEPLSGGDQVTRRLIDRCRQFVDHGVPQDWDGIWVMQNK